MVDMQEMIKKVFGDKMKPKSPLNLNFDSEQAQIEPIYYWILDFVQDRKWETEKIVDNFMSSPGSGNFAEMGQRATKMQEEGMKILGGINQIVKSILSLVYDLKEFEIRLKHYDDYFSEDKGEQEKGMLALKNIWLDNVDMKRGNGAINVLATQMGFATLRDLFYIIKDEEELKKISNDKDGLANTQIQRILTPRLDDFWKWIKYSHKELKNRMSIEKNYLKSQVETIKLYSSWLTPYLNAAEELRQKGFTGNAALVGAFSTSMFELKLFSKKKERLPERFKEYKLKREYYSCVIIGLKFRGHVSQRVTQQGDYGFVRGGRVDMTFEAYAMNDDEISLLKKEMEMESVSDSMKFSTDVAKDALEDLREDIEHFLNDDKEEEKDKKKKSDDINPFMAIFSGLSLSKKEKSKKEISSLKDIKKDNFIEKELRKIALDDAIDGSYSVYDIYKKAHGMASTYISFDNKSF